MVFIQFTARGANSISNQLVTNDETITNSNLSDLLENSKINSRPIGNREKNSSNGKKFERDTSYRVLTPTEEAV